MTVFYTNVARQGNDLLIRIADDNGNRRMLRKKFEPTLYLPTADYSKVEKIGLLNEPLVSKKFASMRDADNYLEEYKEVEGAAVYGQTDYAYQFIAHNFPGMITPDYSNIHIANVDIEVFSAGWRDGEMTKGPFPHATIESHTFKGSEARVRRFHKQVLANHDFVREHFPGSFISNNVTDQFPIIDSNGKITQNMNAAFPITLIQLQDMNTNKFYVWGMPCSKDRAKFRYDENDPEIGGLQVEYMEFVTEQDLLRSFLNYWSQRQFDGWTGWNIETFDSPYLVERITQVLGESEAQRLSPWGKLKKRFIKDRKGDVTSYQFVGCPMMDYMQVYKKHTYTTREKYSLDWIAYCELGEKKLDYSESKSLYDLYFNDYCKHTRYGIKDVKLVWRLEQKLRLIQLMFVLAYRTKSNYEDGLGTVAPWLAMCYYRLYEKGIVPKIQRVYDGPTDFEGAYVMEVAPGIYFWVFSEDLNSLYPHIIQQYNLGPETIVSDKHTRRDIIEAMCEELTKAMNDMTTPMNKRRHLKNLHDKLQRAIDERIQVVDELVALGEFHFETLRRYNVSFTPNVQFFSNEKMSFLSEIMRGIYADRKGEKATGLKYEQWAGWCKEMSKGDFHLESAMKSRFYDPEWYEEHKHIDLDHLTEIMHKWEDLGVAQDTLQQGLKILMNAGYGAISNVWFKEYFNINIAEAITTSGQLINKWNKRHTDDYLNKLCGTTGQDFVIAGDTDSNYICIERLVKQLWPEEKDHHKLVDNIDQWIKENYQPKTSEWAQLLCNTMNGFEQRMVWEREVIASSAVWRAKKMYCMAVYDSEGIKYEKPKIKFKGLEARKSTTPEWCRERLVKCYEKVLLGTEAEVQELIAGYKKEYMELTVDDIAQASGVSDIEKWLDANGNYISGTHFAAKACIMYNKLIDKHEDLGLPPIESGDKVKIINLKPGNPVGNDRIAFPDFLPPELGLDKWVDYHTTFEKTFIEPIQSILDVVGWSHKRRVNLLSMMGKKG